MFTVYCYQSNEIIDFWAVEVNSNYSRDSTNDKIETMLNFFEYIYMFYPQKHSEVPLNLR